MSLGLFTADFLFSLEKDMRVINDQSFLERLTEDDIWYTDLLKVFPMKGKSERFNWLIDTSSIERLSPNDGGEAGGNLTFDELSTVTQEYFPAHFGRATKISKIKLMNMMQAGLNPLNAWAKGVARYGAYVPQRELAITILNGENTLGYDGVNFFSTSHPVHPLIPGLGTYANLFTGASSGSYPGACPIDDSVTIDTALVNLVKVLAYIEGAIAAPNGAGDPRNLHVYKVLYPPQLQRRIQQLLDPSLFIPQQSTGGAGSALVKEVLKKFELAEPQKVKEFDGNRSYTFMGPNGLNSTVTGSDTTWYVIAREASATELGAFLLNERLPFTMQTYSGESGGVEGIDAVLGRSNDLEYHYQGWLAVNPGHPYTVFKVKST
jgi:hypothetical protein